MTERIDGGYDAGNITVLEGLEAVRKRPGMYIGSTGERGLHHLVYEIVDNAVDEALAGQATSIDVTLMADGGVRVADDGRGIPVALHPSEGKPTLEVVMTILHAGGKFGGGGYAVSGGLHGVGMSVVNALSSRFVSEVVRDGYHWKQEYRGGGEPTSEVQRLDPMTEGEHTGTIQTFWADDSIFETTEYDFETLRSRFQQTAFLNKGLKITLTDERAGHAANDDEVTGQIPQVTPEMLGDGDVAGNITIADGEDTVNDTTAVEADPGAQAIKQPGARTVTYKYDGGLVDYVAHLNAAKKVDLVHPEVVSFETEDENRKISAEIAMQWTSAYSESVHTFANMISTPEGGTHEEGFRTAMTTLVNAYARDKGILKDKDDNLTGDDIREGLTAVISMKLSEPQFEGQTKAKLGNTEAKTFVQRVVREQLTDWFDAHPNEAKDIIRKAIQASQARIAARKAREATRRKGVLSSGGMPGKLKDCQSRIAEDCEVYIVEGDSAGGSAVRGRNPHNQAILPIRGKILNVERARLDKALSNQEVQALITAFGTGIGEDFDITKLRYHKIVLMADADVDGQHICTLLLTLLFRYMRPLIENGHVYLAQPPLYRLKWSNAPHDYVYSDRERDAFLEAGIAQGKRIPKENGIQRYKGLGEMDYSELWDTTMDPDNRTLLQMTMDDAAAADEIFAVLMGEDVESRRSFIQRNAKDVRFLDI